MKKLVSLLLAVCIGLSVCVMLTSCGHEHTYKTEWSSDQTYHWHACEGNDCTEASDKAEHTFDNGICTVCNGLQTIGLQFTSNGDGTCKVVDAGNNTDSHVVIPTKSPDGDVVVEIAKEAFFEHPMNTISIADTVKIIGQSAFYNCAKLNNLVLPTGLTAIDNKAFENCSALANVTFPETLTKLGENAFKNTALQVSEYNGAKYLSNGNNAHAYLISEVNSDVSVVNIHADTILIADYAFANNYNIKNITIPANVKHIGECAFGSNSNMQMEITSINLSEGLLTIGKSAFAGCKLIKNITIPSTVKYIGDKAFSDCFVLNPATLSVSIVLPEGVTIGEIFDGGSKIKSITIPENTAFEKVSESGRVFLGDATFETITFGGTYEKWMSLNPSMKPCEYKLICSDGSYSMECTYFENVKK